MDRNKDMKDILRTAYAAFDIEAGSLAATAAALDAAEFEKAVIALASAERIGASGCGHSGIAWMSAPAGKAGAFLSILLTA